MPNAQLQKLAQEHNVSFNDGIETADNDNVHPIDEYHRNRKTSQQNTK